MFTTRLYWFQNDATPADGARKGETDAREYAANRSREVSGKCEVLQSGKVIATYVGGMVV